MDDERMCEGLSRPMVSVVMPVRNMEPFLAESVESILAQDFSDFELIIVDFGSTDGSKKIATRFQSLDSRVRLEEISEEGLVAARNAGAAQAQGKYIAIQDADDLSLPERLGLQVKHLEAHPEIGLVGGMTEWVDASGKKLWVATFPVEESEIKSALVDFFPFCHTSVVMRKDAFVKVGGYRPVMTQSHDYDLALRIAEHYRCANLPEILVKYRVHPFQVSLSRRHKQSYCKLAAQASSVARRSGKSDPLEGVKEITPQFLGAMGISEGQIQHELAAGYTNWIEPFVKSGDKASALRVAQEALQVRWTYLDRAETAKLYLLAAQLYWSQKQFVHSLLVVVRTILIYPPMAMRFVRALARRMGAIEQRSA
jgi:glycosyltransferase involved in cell wall biosynthesis